MLVNLNEVLWDARRNHYGVGLFNTINLEMAKGVIAAAEELQGFYEALFEDYCEAFHSVKNAMRPMKELWAFQLRLFAGENKTRLSKALRKCTDGGEYKETVKRIFRELQLLEEAEEE